MVACTGDWAGLGVGPWGRLRFREGSWPGGACVSISMCEVWCSVGSVDGGPGFRWPGGPVGGWSGAGGQGGTGPGRARPGDLAAGCVFVAGVVDCWCVCLERLAARRVGRSGSQSGHSGRRSDDMSAGLSYRHAVK